MTRVGVLALQGDVRRTHRDARTRSGAEVVAVRTAEQLDGLDGLVMPGGESTTIAYLLTTSGFVRAWRRRSRKGCRSSAPAPD